jgi:hypothetical protein
MVHLWWAWLACAPGCPEADDLQELDNADAAEVDLSGCRRRATRSR